MNCIFKTIPKWSELGDISFELGKVNFGSIDFATYVSQIALG